MKENVKLELDKKSDGDLLLDCGDYVTAMTGNVLFAALYIVAQVLKVKNAVIAFHGALNAPTSDDKKGNIVKTRDIVERETKVLGNQVEEVANDPALPDDQRAGVIESAHMHKKDKTKRGNQKFDVFQSKTILHGAYITAKGIANSHTWAYTKDLVHFTNKTVSDPTTVAHYETGVLEENVEYAFFHLATIPKVATMWEGPIFKKIF